jgi:hypothetical protein
MQPDHVSTWDDFTARKTARETGEELDVQPKPKRQEPSLAALLMQAIHLASERRGRISKAESVRASRPWFRFSSR